MASPALGFGHRDSHGSRIGIGEQTTKSWRWEESRIGRPPSLHYLQTTRENRGPDS